MVKILSRSGDSLADLYDVQGSIAGIEELDSRELPIVHEMGHTLFAERFFTVIRQVVSGDVNQSTNWEVIISNLPQHPFRILGIAVSVNVTARTSIVTVSLKSGTNGREYPIWNWDTVIDGETFVRFSNDGAAVGTVKFLLPSAPMVQLPNIMAGQVQPHPDGLVNVAFRGSTSAFGAGTVEARLLLNIASADVGSGSLSSRGLPIPSW